MKPRLGLLVWVCFLGQGARAQDTLCVVFSLSASTLAANPAIQTAFKQQEKGLADAFSRGVEELHALVNRELTRGRSSPLQFGGTNCRKADVMLRTAGTPGTHSWAVEYKKSRAASAYFAEGWNLTAENPLTPAEVIAELRVKLIGAALEMEKGLMNLFANDSAVQGAARSCEPPENNCAILPSMKRLDGWLRKSRFELHSASPEDENVQAVGRGICVPPVGIKVKLLDVGPEYSNAIWKDNGVKLTNFVHPENPVCRPASPVPKVILPQPAPAGPPSQEGH